MCSTCPSLINDQYLPQDSVPSEAIDSPQSNSFRVLGLSTLDLLPRTSSQSTTRMFFNLRIFWGIWLNSNWFLKSDGPLDLRMYWCVSSVIKNYDMLPPSELREFSTPPNIHSPPIEYWGFRTWNLEPCVLLLWVTVEINSGLHSFREIKPFSPIFSQMVGLPEHP